VLGAVEVNGATASDAQLATPDLHWVAADQLVLDGTVEDLPEPDEVLVDRLGGQVALAQRSGLVAVDLGDGDLREPVLCEERQQMACELVQVCRPGDLAQLGRL
jgi:hypothetical protein